MDYSGLDDSDDQNEGSRALELKFTIGYNSSMRSAVYNLTINKDEKNKKKKEIFFPSGHTGVIYDYQTCERKLLQGHVRIKKKL